ncbi:MAG TPA: sigma-70 family RNA polymerase sigma factor, partial [Trebonia sp.]|nr:sigma-70 family RNA polymerase sigma factor [Trebonia sp.]
MDGTTAGAPVSAGLAGGDHGLGPALTSLIPPQAARPGIPLTELSDSELLARCGKNAHRDAGQAAACDVLVRRYAPLVRACVRQYLDSPESAEDLMQVGYIGLLKAIGNYDPEFGNGLRAYAVPCITGEIKRHFRDK